MATREENLKKINDELEKLNDDELEKVAGGSLGQTADDSRFLNVLLQGTKYHQCDRYGAFRICFDGSAEKDVKAAWNSLDVSLVSNQIGGNDYYLNGQKITQEQAWERAENLVGRHLNKSDWDW